MRNKPGFEEDDGSGKVEYFFPASSEVTQNTRRREQLLQPPPPLCRLAFFLSAERV